MEDDHQLVTDWFAALDEETSINDRADRTVYYFRTLANEPLPDAENIDQDKTPLVFVVKPQKRCGTLWTDAEVLFTPTPLKSQFPKLHKISQSFAKWLKNFDVVYSQKTGGSTEWNYYLEAGIQNYDAELYALPSAMQALRSGQYFVHHQANFARLDKLVQALRLRGYRVENA
jgi:hypothetical protein